MHLDEAHVRDLLRWNEPSPRESRSPTTSGTRTASTAGIAKAQMPSSPGIRSGATFGSHYNSTPTGTAWIVLLLARRDGAYLFFRLKIGNSK
jgi:hypothetical protein